MLLLAGQRVLTSECDVVFPPRRLNVDEEERNTSLANSPYPVDVNSVIVAIFSSETSCLVHSEGDVLYLQCACQRGNICVYSIVGTVDSLRGKPESLM